MTGWEPSSMLEFVPPRLREFLKELCWIGVALLAVTGAFAIAKDPSTAPSWEVMLGLFIGTALRSAFKDDKRAASAA
jgi:hypothetical protein